MQLYKADVSAEMVGRDMDWVPSRDAGLEGCSYFVLLGDRLSRETLVTLIDVPQNLRQEENKTPNGWV